MKYSIREGVVLECVCGESMLISTLKARKYCPYILQLNDASLLIWNGAVEGMSEEQIAEKAAAEYEIPFEQAIETVRQFAAYLCETGHLIPDESQAVPEANA